VFLFLTHVKEKSWPKVKKTMPSNFSVTKNVADMSLVRTKESQCRTKGRSLTKRMSLCLREGHSVELGKVTLDELRGGQS